jgi:hypothetical protein
MMFVMTEPRAEREYLKRLSQWKQAHPPDLSLSFLKKQFKRDIERPYKQLGDLGELWRNLLPATLVAQTRLEGLSRGVLRVTVSSSAALYEIDRLLREGLERELKRQHKGTLTKVRLRVGMVGGQESE